MFRGLCGLRRCAGCNQKLWAAEEYQQRAVDEGGGTIPYQFNLCSKTNIGENRSRSVDIRNSVTMVDASDSRLNDDISSSTHLGEYHKRKKGTTYKGKISPAVFHP